MLFAGFLKPRKHQTYNIVFYTLYVWICRFLILFISTCPRVFVTVEHSAAVLFVFSWSQQHKNPVINIIKKRIKTIIVPSPSSPCSSTQQACTTSAQSIVWMQIHRKTHLYRPIFVHSLPSSSSYLPPQRPIIHARRRIIIHKLRLFLLYA